jgi:RPA family protein
MAEENKSYERAPAMIVRIVDLIKGQYFKVEGNFNPDYVLVGEKKISRVNMVAIVIEKNIEERFSSLTIDDGSGSIVLRDFDNKNKFENFNIGQVIMTIAKPRNFNEQMYLITEIIKPIKNNKWIEYRKLQLEKISPMVIEKVNEEIIEDKPIVEEMVSNSEVENKPKTNEPEKVSVDEPENIIDKVLAIIKELDSGEGADIEDVIVKADVKDCEPLLNSLIKEGEIFEVRPGRIKVL